MFNLGAAEIVVLLLLAFIFLARGRLPEVARVFRSRDRMPIEPRWSWTDWLLVSAAVLSATGALATFVSARR